MDKFSTNQKMLISGLIGFIIGIGSVLVWNVDNTANDIKEDGTMEEEHEGESMMEGEGGKVPILVNESDSVSVDEQRAGSSVFIASLNLESAGWVAIHEDRGGELGNVLGARLFSKGTSIGEVELLRNTVPGNTYHAVLYNDNDNRAFELGIDALIVDIEQNPIMDTFNTTVVPVNG